MSERRALFARSAGFAMILVTAAGCDQFETATDAQKVAEPEPEMIAEPSLFDTALTFAAYGASTTTIEGNSVQVTLTGGGEGGVAISLRPELTSDTVIGFTLDAPAPMNLRLARTDGAFDYLSTENRGHVILGPNAAIEALIYSAQASVFTLTVIDVQSCGGPLVCAANGSVSVLIGEAGSFTALLAEPFGAAALSSTAPDAIVAARRALSGEYGFTLTRAGPGQEDLLVEFQAVATSPVNVMVEANGIKEYSSSEQGWIQMPAESNITVYTPEVPTFEFAQMKVSACTPEEIRCTN